MKNLYGKSKGKIHPDGVGGGSSNSSNNSAALQAALALLPAAILALAAALSPEDREVLAYLVSRSLRSPAAAVGPAEEQHPPQQRWRSNNSGSSRGKGAGGGVHHHQQQKHGFECGCFDCYRGFWCRWDASPDREVIHQAIEAFEEHLASGEMMEREAGNKGRRRGARGRNRGKGPKGGPAAAVSGGDGGAGGRVEDGGNNSNGKGGNSNRNKGGGEKKKDKVAAGAMQHEAFAVEHEHHLVPTKPEVAVATGGGMLVATPLAAVDAFEPSMEDANTAVAMELHQDNEYYYAVSDGDDRHQPHPSEPTSSSSSCSIAAERRRGGWADVMGLFNSRLWSLWNPGA